LLFYICRKGNFLFGVLAENWPCAALVSDPKLLFLNTPTFPPYHPLPKPVTGGKHSLCHANTKEALIATLLMDRNRDQGYKQEKKILQN
jgi:hypothetical protein